MVSFLKCFFTLLESLSIPAYRQTGMLGWGKIGGIITRLTFFPGTQGSTKGGGL